MGFKRFLRGAALALGVLFGAAAIAPQPAHAFTTYFACGEDLCFANMGEGYLDSTSGHFRSGYARGDLGVTGDQSNPFGWRCNDCINGSTGLASFWFSAQAYNLNKTNGSGVINLAFTDANNVERLYIDNAGPSNTLELKKQTAAGSVTTLVSSSGACPQGNTSTLLRLTVQVSSYGSSGTVNVYENGASSPCITYTGNIATDSATVLNGFDLGTGGGLCGGCDDAWSEMMVADSDLRSASLVTLDPTGNGNTQAWTCTGSTNYGSVNPFTEDDTHNCNSGTAAQLEEFSLSGLPSGSFQVMALVAYYRAIAGSSGPQNLQSDVRAGGTSHQSSNLTNFQGGSPGLSLQTFQSIWATNPTTSAAWSTSDIGSVQTGMESQN